MQVDMVENIGFAAAACTTLSFIPQLTKIRKQGGRDLYLTYTMLSVYLLGLALWLAYGIWLHAPAVVVAHAASIALVVGHSHEGYRGGSPTGPLGDLASPRGISDSQPENRRPIIG